MQTTEKTNKQSVNRRDRAIQIWGEKGGSKADALREAGFSNKIIDNPQRVFNTPYAMEVLEKAGVDLDGALKQLNRKVKSRSLDNMTFPPFNKEKHDKSINGENSDGLKNDLNDTDSSDSENTGEKRGEQLTDDDIREMLSEVNCTVRKIVHGSQARYVYFWTDNDKAQLDAIEKIINLHGLYAPKKTEQKIQTTHTFSMAGLRKKAIDIGEDIIDVQIDEPVETVETLSEPQIVPEPVRSEPEPEAPVRSGHANIASKLEESL